MSTTSKPTRSSSRFGLHDLEAEPLPELRAVIKKETLPPAAPKTEPKGKGSGSSKKRKSSDAIDLDTLEPAEAIPKLISLSKSVSDHVSKFLDEARSRVERAEKAEEMLKDREIVLAKLNTSLTVRVEQLERKEKEASMKHAAEIEEVVRDTKASAKEAVLEIKIRTAEEAGGEKHASWDLVGWKANLSILKGEEPSDIQDPGLEASQEKQGEDIPAV